MSEDEWKARAVGCEAESKRLAGEVKRLAAELERMTGYLLDARRHIQAAAVGYEWNRIRDPEPVHLRTVDHGQKIQDCRRLFDVIEAIEESRLGAALDRSGGQVEEDIDSPAHMP